MPYQVQNRFTLETIFKYYDVVTRVYYLRNVAATEHAMPSNKGALVGKFWGFGSATRWTVDKVWLCPPITGWVAKAESEIHYIFNNLGLININLNYYFCFNGCE